MGFAAASALVQLSDIPVLRLSVAPIDFLQPRPSLVTSLNHLHRSISPTLHGTWYLLFRALSSTVRRLGKLLCFTASCLPKGKSMRRHFPP